MPSALLVFFSNYTATTEIYTLSLHDALPISSANCRSRCGQSANGSGEGCDITTERSEEHTSELQSHSDLVCRLLLEKKKKDSIAAHSATISVLHARRGEQGQA